MSQAPTPVWRRVPTTLLVGIPLTMGLLVGLAVGFQTDRSEVASSVAVISTRPAAALPNDRIDLINDFSTAITLPPVVEEVADSQGVDVADLRDGLAFERIDSSSFARLTLSSDSLDDEQRRAVLRSLISVTERYLSPVTPSPALVAAQRDEKAATDAYYAALSAGGGVPPAERLSRLNARIRAAAAAKQPNLVALLQKQVPGLVNSSRRLDLLAAARQRASETLQDVTSTEAEEGRGGADALGVSFVSADDPATGASGSVVGSEAVRRGVAAGIAAALVIAGFTLAVAYGRGRSRDREGDEDDLDPDEPDEPDVPAPAAPVRADPVVADPPSRVPTSLVSSRAGARERRTTIYAAGDTSGETAGDTAVDRSGD